MRCPVAGALHAVAATQPPALPAVTTEAIREAWQRMAALLHEAGARAAEICAAGEDWSSRAPAAMDGVVRKSVEMRLVVTLMLE